METWALLIDWIGNEFADVVTRVVQEDSSRRSRSLVVFTLGSLSYHVAEANLENQIGRVLRRPGVDRVLWSAGQIVRGGGDAKIASILKRMPPRPMLTLGARIEGVAHLEVGHDRAYRTLLDHLWCDHGYRRYAWVGGPPDNPVAVRRRGVFLDFLADHGAHLRKDLDLPGDFNLSVGRDAGVILRAMMGEFDVVVAANDAMAVGLREVLGSGIPVTGFDNHPSAARTGLSTVDSELEQEVLAALHHLDRLPGDGMAPDPIMLGRVVLRSSCGCPGGPVEVPALPDTAGSSTQRIGPLFEAILEARDLPELSDTLNRTLPSENVGFWKILTADDNSDEDFRPEGADRTRLDLVVHSLFREEELFGFLVHDLSNRDYTLSEWLRINVSLAFAAWHRQSGNIQAQKLLRTEIDRFSRRQKEVDGIINALPVWIVEVDRRLQIRYGNRAWMSMMGRPTADRATGPFLETVFSEDREQVEVRLVAIMKSRGTSSLAFRFTPMEGPPVGVLGEIQYLGDDGGPQLAHLFGSLYGAGGLRLAGMIIEPLVTNVLQPDDLMLRHFDLSPREREVLGWTAQGLDSAEMAGVMGISAATIRVVLHNIYIKTGVSGKKELLEVLADYHSLAPRPKSLTQVLLARLLGRR